MKDSIQILKEYMEEKNLKNNEFYQGLLHRIKKGEDPLKSLCDATEEEIKRIKEQEEADLHDWTKIKRYVVTRTSEYVEVPMEVSVHDEIPAYSYGDYYDFLDKYPRFKEKISTNVLKRIRPSFIHNPYKYVHECILDKEEWYDFYYNYNHYPHYKLDSEVYNIWMSCIIAMLPELTDKYQKKYFGYAELIICLFSDHHTMSSYTLSFELVRTIADLNIRNADDLVYRLNALFSKISNTNRKSKVDEELIDVFNLRMEKRPINYYTDRDSYILRKYGTSGIDDIRELRSKLISSMKYEVFKGKNKKNFNYDENNPLHVTLFEGM